MQFRNLLNVYFANIIITIKCQVGIYFPCSFKMEAACVFCIHIRMLNSVQFQKKCVFAVLVVFSHAHLRGAISVKLGRPFFMRGF